MHPSESNLALYAGRDIGLLQRLRISRHLQSCDACMRQVESYRSMREWLAEQDDEMPAGVDWDRLAVELKANIRLGLAAGECVNAAPRPVPAFQWRRAAMALPVLVLVIAIVLMQSVSPAFRRHSQSGLVLEASQGGIGLEQNGRGFTLLYPRAEGVISSVSGPAAVSAGYVDAETGYVTISHVYAQ